jgi:hypothetical protein
MSNGAVTVERSPGLVTPVTLTFFTTVHISMGSTITGFVLSIVVTTTPDGTQQVMTGRTPEAGSSPQPPLSGRFTGTGLGRGDRATRVGLDRAAPAELARQELLAYCVKVTVSVVSPRRDPAADRIQEVEGHGNLP